MFRLFDESNIKKKKRLLQIVSIDFKEELLTVTIREVIFFS